MNAEIINIGDELLIGQVVNTNAAWLGEELSLAGIRVIKISVIADQEEAIRAALEASEPNTGLILITGGLGPTRDDITKSCLCKFFNTRLVFNESAHQNILRLFGARGYAGTGNDRAQAEIPENCQPIPNPNGTAPGMWFEKNDKVYISLPGVPFEMKPMVSNYILPELLRRFPMQAIVHKTVLTQGAGESALARTISQWEEALPQHIKLAYLPQPGIVRLRLSAYGSDKDLLTSHLDKQIHSLKAIIPELIFGYDLDKLEEICGKLLLEKKASLVTAESCTGGYLSHLITSVEGSSAYYKGSLIAYSNELKINILGIIPETIEQEGAVSEAVVVQMATNAKNLFHAEYAIAVSGIAGPCGATPGKPVGTTWIAVASPGETIARQFLFGEHRGRNIHRAAITALNLLRKVLAGMAH